MLPTCQVRGFINEPRWKEEQSPNLQAPAQPVMPSAHCRWFQGRRACLLKSFLSRVQRKETKNPTKDGDKGREHLKKEDGPTEEPSSNSQILPDSPGSITAPHPNSLQQIFCSRLFPPPCRMFCGVTPQRMGSPRVGTLGRHPQHSTPLPARGTPGGSVPQEARPGRFGKARAMILCYS